MFLQALQFQQQQAALQQAQAYATQFGNAPGGNWMQWGAGGPTQPAAGTATLGALGQYAQLGMGAAGLTGQFNNPQAWQYQPGTYIRDMQTGQVGQIQAGGQLVVLPSAPAGVDANTFPQVDTANFQLLRQGQGQMGQTQQATAQAAQIAANQAAQTGLYQQPMGNIVNDAFAKASPSTQQTYLKQYEGDPTEAAQHYWGDVQGALQQAGMTPEQFVYGTNGPTPTMALQQMYGTYGVPQQGQQTLQAINQAATLSGMYQGAPTEAAREFNQNLALQQGQLGQQYLSTAAQLQGPQNTFQLSNYLRGAAGNPNVPVYLQNLANNMAAPAFQATGTTAPTPQSAAGLIGQMGGTTTPSWTTPEASLAQYANPSGTRLGPTANYGQATYNPNAPTGYMQMGAMQGDLANPNTLVADQNYNPNQQVAPSGAIRGTSSGTQPGWTPGALATPALYQTGAGQTTPTSATPGWDYTSTLNTIRGIAQRGAQGLAPGSLERMSPDEMQAFGSGLGAAGYSLPSFMNQYAQSRVGQQAPIARTTLA